MARARRGGLFPWHVEVGDFASGSVAEHQPGSGIDRVANRPELVRQAADRLDRTVYRLPVRHVPR